MPLYTIQGDKLSPCIIRVCDRISTLSQTLLIQGDNLSTCSVYRAILDTGGSNCTNSALCIVAIVSEADSEAKHDSAHDQLEET